MSEIKFACPFCSQHIACDADYADLAIDCPSCGKSMVVPRLSSRTSSNPGLVIVASAPLPPHTSPPPPIITAWTEQEWAQLSRHSNADAEAPHWVVSLMITLVIVFVLKIKLVSSWFVILALILGAVISAALMSKGRKSTGAFLVLRGLGFSLLFIFVILPVVALGILFIGCASGF
jgi:hypothetical protein